MLRESDGDENRGVTRPSGTVGASCLPIQLLQDDLHCIHGSRYEVGKVLIYPRTALKPTVGATAKIAVLRVRRALKVDDNTVRCLGACLITIRRGMAPAQAPPYLTLPAGVRRGEKRDK